MKLRTAYKLRLTKRRADVDTDGVDQIRARLSEIIKVLNDRLGTNFTSEDRLLFAQIRERAVNDEQIIRLRRANPLDKFQLGLKSLLEKLMMQRMADNDQFVTRYLEDKQFGEAAFDVLSRAIYEEIVTNEK